MTDLKLVWASILKWINYFRLGQNLIGIFGAAGAVWVFVESLEDDLPFAIVLTLTFLTLASIVAALNQLRLLMGGSIVVENRIDLRHGLSFVDVSLAFDSTPNTGGLQFGLILANNSNVPIQFEAERFDVIIGNFTVPYTAKTFVNKGVVIHLRKVRQFRDSPIPIALIQPLLGSTHRGSLEASFKYGRAGDPFIRRYRVKLEINVNLGARPGTASVVLEEMDEDL